MKYPILFGLAALAIGFTACDDIEDSNSTPQSNPQLDMVSADNVSLTQGPAAASTIDLTALNAADASIDIAKVTEASDWPEGFVADVPYMQFSKTEDFKTFATIEATMGAEGSVLVEPDAWEEAYKELVGKSPLAAPVYVRFPIVAVNGNQKIRMGGEDYYYGNFGVTVKPFDVFNGQIIEDSYYLITNVDNWDITKAQKFTHSDKDVYDDPVFTLVADVNGAGFEWAIIPATTFDAGTLGIAYGVSDQNEAAGTLVETPAGTAITYGLINEAGPHMMTINMLDLTYESKLAYQQLYTPGNSNNWNFGASQKLTTTDFANYTGYVHLNGEFKLTSDMDWNHGNWGAGQGEGNLASNSQNNLQLPAEGDGLYWMSVNILELKYTTTYISTIGLIGDATPAGWDASTALTPSADFLTWTGTMALKNGQFKFRANDGWDINLGGSISDLQQNGENISFTDEGTYVVTLDLSAIPYTATFTKQ